MNFLREVTYKLDVEGETQNQAVLVYITIRAMYLISLLHDHFWLAIFFPGSLLYFFVRDHVFLLLVRGKPDHTETCFAYFFGRNFVWYHRAPRGRQSGDLGSISLRSSGNIGNAKSVPKDLSESPAGGRAGVV